MPVKRLFFLLIMLGTMMLSGCNMPEPTLDPEDLYRLPTLPAKYTELNLQLNEILEQGADYAAPASGANTQPVQMVDLDGDGREEALAFFGNSKEEKPLKIYIFKADGDTYRHAALIEGTGTGFYSIAYEDLDQDGRSELTRSHLLQAEIATTGMPRLERLWKALFSNYTKRQERMTPQLQRLLTALEKRGSAPLPQGFAEAYRQGSLPLMPWANTLSFNTRFLALVIAMLLGMPWLYLLFECTVLNYLAWLMPRKHEALCKTLMEKYQL